jgi:hypothetical protein
MLSCDEYIEIYGLPINSESLDGFSTADILPEPNNPQAEKPMCFLWLHRQIYRLWVKAKCKIDALLKSYPKQIQLHQAASLASHAHSPTDGTLDQSLSALQAPLQSGQSADHGKCRVRSLADALAVPKPN